MAPTHDDGGGEDAYSKTNAYLDGQWMAHSEPDQSIAITGLAGMYPDSRNVHEFQHNLLNKVDMVSADSRRWSPTHPEIPQRGGKLFDIEKFDAGFFGVHQRQADSMDPMARMVMERAVECIMDAGVNPTELAGTKTGVFVGACFCETEKTWFYEKLESQRFGITGCERSLMCNRISSFLKLTGPSMIVDTACSSSLSALENAYRAIRSGVCDQALVGGTNVCLHPFVSLQFARLGVLSADGTCKVFDAHGDGYSRSEAVCCIFLQKASQARRIYGTVVHAKANCDGYKEQGITFPSGQTQKRLLLEFYQECGVPPYQLSFLEAHGTGTKVGDPEEIAAMDEVLSPGRDRPLLVGSVKSNIGHSEPTSGLCSVTKAIIAFETGLIPPNIHFTRVREGVEALERGRFKVVTDKHPFEDDRGLIAINSFGFGGANCHTLLRWNAKSKSTSRNDVAPLADNLDRLVCVSGRTPHAVRRLLDDVASRPPDHEHIHLMHRIFAGPIAGFNYRGYLIHDGGTNAQNDEKLKHGDRTPCRTTDPVPELVVRFGRMRGTPCQNVVTSQMWHCPPVREAVQRMQEHLRRTNEDADLIELMRSESPPAHICWGVTQLAMVDVIRALNLKPCAFEGTTDAVCAYACGMLSLAHALRAIVEHRRLSAASEWWSSSDRPNNWLDVSALAALVKRRRCVLFEFGYTEEVNKVVPRVCVPGATTFHAFLEALGELYMYGHDMQIHELYPAISYPVSRGTAMISPVIGWNHDHDWFVTKYTPDQNPGVGERIVVLSMREDNWAFLSGHLIDGRNLFPATGYLDLAWETLSLTMGKMISDMQIVFENCKFHRATAMVRDGTIELVVMLHRKTGNFEVSEGGVTVASGVIREVSNFGAEQVDLPQPVPVRPEHGLPLTKKDIYKDLRLRGYNYEGKFRNFSHVDSGISTGALEWEGNWITFLDSLLHIRILQMDTRLLYVPTCIRRLSIDAKRHIACAQALTNGSDEKAQIPIYMSADTGTIKCGGIELRGLLAASIPRRRPLGQPVLEYYAFMPNACDHLTRHEAVRAAMQMALENMPAIKIKAIELLDEAVEQPTQTPLAATIHSVLGDLPLLQPDICILSKDPLPEPIANVTVDDRKLVAQTECYLVVGHAILQRPLVLNQAFGALRDGCFVLSREAPDFRPQTCRNLSGLSVLCCFKVADDTETLVLLRKEQTAGTTAPQVVRVDDTDSFEWVELAQNVLKATPTTPLILYSQANVNSGLLGLVNCLRREPGGTHVRGVYIDDADAPPFDPQHPFYAKQLRAGHAINVLRNGQWGTYRHLPIKDVDQIECEHAYVNVTVRGDLSSLRWIEGPLKFDSTIEPERVLVHIYYAALNFRDIMTASGRINADVITMDRTKQECVQGFEFSGRTTDGTRIMGMVTSGALATLLEADPQLMWNVPDSWTMEEAATIPVVYGTVVFAFFVRAHIKRGDTILVHSGTGGIGQASITVALAHGCTIFTTVSTQEKRDFLLKRYPQLTDSHIGNSRDTSFEQMIMRETNGRGVDYVLNSLSDEKLQASIRCLARGGTFLEIGKFDLANDTALQMLLVERDVCFQSVMLDQYFLGSSMMKMKMFDLVNTGMENGWVIPLSYTMFERDDIEKAFRYMTSGKHMGKVLVRVRDEEPGLVATQPVRHLCMATPHHHCRPDKVTVIVGGLGGFGLELADWLVLRGCRHLVLSSRSGVRTGYQSRRIQLWRSYGAQVLVSTADVTTEAGCRQLMEAACAMGRIQSVFNLAVVLHDALFENQTGDTYRTSFAPKAYATVWLDQVCRQLCPDLEDFVVFSSVSCGRGNAGQTNYGMANAIMERVCERRAADGLPALAIEWGAVGEVGLVAEMQENHQELEIGGTLQQRISSCLEVLDGLLKQRHPIASSMVVAEKRGGAGGADNIVDAVANILGIQNLKTVSSHSTLAELGMDSMTAVEIKQTLEREFEVFLTAQDIRSMTFSRLQEIQDEKVREIEGVLPKKEKPLGGFEMVLRLINDERVSRIPLVTGYGKGVTAEEKDSPSLPNVLMFTGVEGVSDALKPLMQQLPLRSLVIQYSYDNPEDTIPAMAETLLPLVRENISKSEPFRLVGYSYGSIVALETVKLLEQEGYFGTLVIIDGGPELMMTLLKSQMDVDSEVIFQTSLLCQLMAIIMSLEVVMKNKDRIMKANTFEDRMNVFEEVAPKDTPHSPDYMRKLGRGLYKRLKALSAYQADCGGERKLKSRLVLFKPTIESVPNLSKDYKLGELCTEPVETHVFAGNHVTILSNPDVGAELLRQFGCAPVEQEKEVPPEQLPSAPTADAKTATPPESMVKDQHTVASIEMDKFKVQEVKHI